jgi:PAS domain S-box-containing protein
MFAPHASYFKYLFALGAALSGAALRWAMVPVLMNATPGVTFLPAIIASAWYGGIASGLLATIASYALGRYFFITPGTLSIHGGTEMAQAIILLAGGGLITGISAALREASAREEEARREAAQVLESVSDGFVALDPEFRFTFLNAAAERMASRQPDELVGKTFWEAYPASLGTVVEREFRNAMESRQAVSFEHYYEPWRRWLQMQAQPHEAGGLSVYFHDITERKRQEEQLARLNRELEQRLEELRTILKVAPVGLAITNDLNGAEIRANAYLEDLTGSPPGSNISLTASGRSSYAFFQDEREIPAEDLPIRRALREGSAIPPAEYRLVRENGKEFFVLLQANPLREPDGEVFGAVGAYTDITANKRTEKSLWLANRSLERSNADLEQFAYAAAHDLQEPLRNLIGYTELIARRHGDKLDADGASLLEVVISSGARMQTMIRDLLAYCQAVDPAERPAQLTDANMVVETVLAHLHGSLEQCGATIQCETLPSVRIPEAQLLQVFQNLIGNAVKYRGNDPPQIRISASQKADEWVFLVKDNGIGIRPEYAGRIFGLFRRLHGVEIPGTGIGLAICKRIIDHYGGRIWVQSQEGAGATFYFALPEAMVALGVPGYANIV